MLDLLINILSISIIVVVAITFLIPLIEEV